MTASKIGRSRSGPVEKYSSSDMAGEHSCDWPFRANRRWHSGQVRTGMGYTGGAGRRGSMAVSERMRATASSADMPATRNTIPMLKIARIPSIP